MKKVRRLCWRFRRWAEHHQARMLEAELGYTLSRQVCLEIVRLREREENMVVEKVLWKQDLEFERKSAAARFYLEVTPETVFIVAKNPNNQDDWREAKRLTEELRATGFHSDVMADLADAGVVLN